MNEKFSVKTRSGNSYLFYEEKGKFFFADGRNNAAEIQSIRLLSDTFPFIYHKSKKALDTTALQEIIGQQLAICYEVAGKSDEQVLTSCVMSLDVA